MLLGYGPQVQFCGMVDTNCASNGVLRGNKSLWHTQNSIEVTIVNHTEFETTEVIAYDPLLHVEAERMYLDSNTLHFLWSHDGVDPNQNDVPLTVHSHADKSRPTLSDFVLNLLLVKEFLEDGELKFTIILHIDAEKLGSGARLKCDKPAGLLPFTAVTKNIEKNGKGVMFAVEQNCHRGQCPNAIGPDAVRAVLSHKERWRIPVVLVKISRNRSLNDADSKIWATVSFNLHAQEQMDRSAGCTHHVGDCAPTYCAAADSPIPLHCICYTPTPSQSNTPHLTPRLSSYPSPPDSPRVDNSVANSQNEKSSARDGALQAALLEPLESVNICEVSLKPKRSFRRDAQMNGSDNSQGELTMRNYIAAGLTALAGLFAKKRVRIANSGDADPDETLDNGTRARRIASISVRTSACTSAPTSPRPTSTVAVAGTAAQRCQLRALSPRVRGSSLVAQRLSPAPEADTANAGSSEQQGVFNNNGIIGGDDNISNEQPVKSSAGFMSLFLSNKVSPDSSVQK